MANQLAVPSLNQGAALSPQPVAFPFASGNPPEGPLSALVVLSIPAGQLTGQLTTNISQYGMSMVQSLLVDNEANSVALTVRAGTIGTNFGIQPFGTQIIPVYQTGVNLITTVTLGTVQTAATVIAFQIFNSSVPPASWVSNLSVSGDVNIASITGTVDVAVQGTTPVSITGGSIMIAGGVVDVSGSTIKLSGGVNLVAGMAGGASYMLFNPLTNTVVSLISNRLATFKGLYALAAAAAQFIQVFDAATPGAVTLGTTSPNLILTIPVVANPVIIPFPIPPEGLAFTNGIQLACTLTATGAGVVAVPPIVIGYYG
jgi:hypothetical protein